MSECRREPGCIDGHRSYLHAPIICRTRADPQCPLPHSHTPTLPPSGAIVGGTAGAVAGALAKAGYADEEARYYGESVEKGAVMVAVDMTASAISEDEVRRILADHGGRFYGEEAVRRAA